MNIFYCDDDKEDIVFFTEIVQRINPDITVTSVSDPEQALEILEQMSVKPAYLFFDSNMPKLEGIECAIAIKRNKFLRRIPFVIISGGLEATQIAAYNKLGVHNFVAKTTNLDDLQEALRVLLNQQET